MAHSGRPAPAAITSTRSDRVRRVGALAGRSARRRTGTFRVEGPQAVCSLLTTCPDLIVDLFLTENTARTNPELVRAAAGADIVPRSVSPEILRALLGTPPVDEGPQGSPMVTPQGVLAVARIPERAWTERVAELPPDVPVTVLVLAAVQDPGNVGTLIRSADAAGCDLVVLTAGSADPYAPKTVRASAGSLFHVPVATGADITALRTAFAAADVAVAATSGRADHDLFDVDLPGRIAWVMGNEAHGIDQELLDASDMTVRIPLAGRAESLNVQAAATVCLFETLRRRRARPTRSRP